MNQDQQKKQLQHFPPSTVPGAVHSTHTDVNEKNHQKMTTSSALQHMAPTVTPGAVPMKNDDSKMKKEMAKKYNGGSRGSRRQARHLVDDEETETPEEMMSRTSVSSSSQPTSGRARQNETSQVPNTAVDYNDYDEEEQHGAFAVAGMGGSEVNTNNDFDYMNNQGPNEAIVNARLVDENEGIISDGEREQIRREAEEQIINKAVKAEISEEEDYRKWYICACLCTVIVIGAVVGAVLGTRRADITPPNNSFCDQAIPITLDGDGEIDSIDNSSPIEVDTCVFDVNEGETSAGRWYSFVGAGASVTASTCFNTNFNTRISIYSGSSCDNDDLMCIDGNENNPTACCAVGNPNCEQRSAVTWSAVEGLQYFIFVHGANADEVGTFQLQLTSSPKESNNFCETAVRLTSNGIPVSGSNELATFTNVETCGSVVETGPGVWYEVKGVGGLMIATTCDGTSTSLLDTQISVLTGTCGEDGDAVDSLQCIAANDNDDCGGDIVATRSRITWESVLDETYFIYVHSKDGQRGTFELSVEKLEVVDQAAECLDKNVELLETPGIGDALADFNQNSLSGLNFEEACVFSGLGIVCTIDLNDFEQTIRQPCELNEGRYIEIDVELNCEGGALVLAMINYPNCISLVCDDDLIQSILETQFDVAVSTIAAQGITCEVGDINFER